MKYCICLILIAFFFSTSAQVVGGLYAVLENEHDKIGIGAQTEKYLGNSVALNFSFIAHFNNKVTFYGTTTPTSVEIIQKLWHTGIGLSLYPIKSKTVEFYGFWAAAFTKSAFESSYIDQRRSQPITEKHVSSTFGIDFGLGLNFITSKMRLKPFIESKINFSAERLFVSGGIKYVIKQKTKSEVTK